MLTQRLSKDITLVDLLIAATKMHGPNLTLPLSASDSKLNLSKNGTQSDTFDWCHWRGGALPFRIDHECC